MKNIIILFILLISLAVFVRPAKADLPDDLVGLWKFNEDSGETAIDSALPSDDGTLHGPEVNSIDGTHISYLFDGVNDYVSIPEDDNNLDLDNLTLEAWIKIDSSSTNSGTKNIVRKGNFSNRSYGLDITDGKLRGFINRSTTPGGTALIVQANFIIEKGLWHHVVMTFDGYIVRIYNDGSLVGTSSYFDVSPFTNNFSVRIGGQPSSEPGGALAFKGLIDEVRIWKRALSEDELNDELDDEILGSADLCENTTSDILFSENLGVNRYSWNGNVWITVKPKTKELIEVEEMMTMTRGCSCFDILRQLPVIDPDLYGEMEGHWKFGCSKSVIEDFVRLTSN